jgi:hypothetical protein
LERWKREEKLSGSLGKVTQKGEAEVVSTSKAVDQRPPERALSPLREILEISAGPPESSKEFRANWEGANILRSPTLSGLQLALKIDNEFLIPPPFRLSSPNQQFITQDQWSDLIKRPAHDVQESTAETSNTLDPSYARRRQLSFSELYICNGLLSQMRSPGPL